MKSNILPLTTGTYYITLRQDFLLLCQACTYRKDKSRSSAHCKALILSVLENWTNKKIDGGKDLHISMTMPQWKESLYGMYGENVITDSLEELLHEGLIGREKFRVPGMSGKDQYKYVLKYRVITERLETLKNTGLIEGKPVNFRDEPVNFSVQTSKNTGLPSSQTLKSTDYVDNAQNHTIESTQSRCARGYYDASVSSESLEEQTDAKAEETHKPAVPETRRETQAACFEDANEQVVFDIARQSACMRHVSDTPTLRARNHIAKVARQLEEYGISASTLTPQAFDEAWEAEKRIKKLEEKAQQQGDEPVECQWGNLPNAMPRQLAKMVKKQHVPDPSPDGITFLPRTATDLREMARLNACNEEAALAEAQKRFEQSGMSVDVFDGLVASAIMAVATQTYTDGDAWLRHVVDYLDAELQRQMIPA